MPRNISGETPQELDQYDDTAISGEESIFASDMASADAPGAASAFDVPAPESEPEKKSSSFAQWLHSPLLDGESAMLVLVAIATAIFVIASCALSMYHSASFVQSKNAVLYADTAVITPAVSGKLSEWNVKVGDAVAAGTALGRVDTGTNIETGQIDLAHLSDAASFSQSKSEIKTPISGRVIHSDIVLDTEVSPGMALAVIADTDKMYAVANVTTTDALKLKPGQYVSVSIPGYASSFGGYVQTVGQTTSGALNTLLNGAAADSPMSRSLVAVKISIVNNDKRPFILGTDVSVRIDIR